MAIPVTEEAPLPRVQSSTVSPLENGMHLGATEFLRRYEAMPEIKKAELIGGIVYMGSPVRADQHGEPDGLVQTWLGTYAITIHGVRHGTNSTVHLGAMDVLQPDAFLRLQPELGGKSRIDEKGYIQGPPELVAEIAASSANLDAREKRDSYRRCSITEYLLWRTEDRQISWWYLHEDEYVPLPSSSDGVLRSRVFPGLWLDTKAALARDGAALIAKLNEGMRSEEYLRFAERLRQNVR
jgi:Uma2 family endonuclease